VQSVIDGNQPESKNYEILEVSWGTYKDSPTYTKGHIPGAIHVDTSSVESEPIWNISDPKVVEKGMLDLGVTKDKTIILYGNDISA
ncbi:sulfurtransferase, partial [Casaltella massiliensis]|nr:sulfurtransferase [Casaltella massiliensis]